MYWRSLLHKPTVDALSSARIEHKQHGLPCAADKPRGHGEYVLLILRGKHNLVLRGRITFLQATDVAILPTTEHDAIQPTAIKHAFKAIGVVLGT
jgi:hypothetical protein